MAEHEFGGRRDCCSEAVDHPAGQLRHHEPSHRRHCHRPRASSLDLAPTRAQQRGRAPPPIHLTPLPCRSASSRATSGSCCTDSPRSPRLPIGSPGRNCISTSSRSALTPIGRGRPGGRRSAPNGDDQSAHIWAYTASAPPATYRFTTTLSAPRVCTCTGRSACRPTSGVIATPTRRTRTPSTIPTVWRTTASCSRHPGAGRRPAPRAGASLRRSSDRGRSARRPMPPGSRRGSCRSAAAATSTSRAPRRFSRRRWATMLPTSNDRGAITQSSRSIHRTSPVGSTMTCPG